MGTPIRVAVVATFPLLHEGLVRILDDDPSLCVVPDRFTCTSLADGAARLEVNLAVVHLPSTDQPCVWNTLHALCDKLKVLILLKHDDHESVRRAIEIGVMGILTEDASGITFFKAIHDADLDGDGDADLFTSDRTDVRPLRSERGGVLVNAGRQQAGFVNRLALDLDGVGAA